MVGPDKLDGVPQHSPTLPSKKTSPSGQPMAQKPSAPASPPIQDSVDLSTENTEYAQVLKQINKVPDIRHERVEEIRKSLEAGTYDINSHLVAKRIIQEVISEGAPAKKQPHVSDTSQASYKT